MQQACFACEMKARKHQHHTFFEVWAGLLSFRYCAGVVFSSLKNAP